jgi:uncharacterized protein YecE (DUF72 family)
MAAKIRIGISGWRYPPWRDKFYPHKLVQAKELQFASRALPTIEINGTFYSLQRPSSFEHWYADTPEGFVFSMKAPRYITHILRLNDVEKPIANFFASGIFHLKEKLGPILWQFPPSFKFDAVQFEDFIKLLPHDTETALKMAHKREDRMHGKEYLEIDMKLPLRHAVEIRNESFIDKAFIQLLRHYNIAFVIADTGKRWPEKEDVTGDFVYIRLHGDEKLYESNYMDKTLDHWAQRIQTWSEGGQVKGAQLIADLEPPARKSRDIFCYFDNTTKINAPFNARKLLGKLGLEKGLEQVEWSKYDDKAS